MASFPTRTDIRSQIRRIADIETDANHITDGEIDEDINTSASALWALLLEVNDGSLLAKVAPDPPQIGENAYQLPSDFLRLVSVDVFRHNTYVHSTAADPQRHAQLSFVASRSLSFSQHYLQFNSEEGRYELFIFPGPSQPNTLFVKYVPEAPQVFLDTDTMKLPADWYRWIVYDVGIKCNIKEETDPTPLMAERQKIEVRIQKDVASHSVSQVKSIRDVSVWEDGGRFALPPINSTGS